MQILSLLIYKTNIRTIIDHNNRKISYLYLTTKNNQRSNLFLLYNILYGNASFVGSELVDYSIKNKDKINIKPGLASLCQINFSNNKPNDFDFHYIQNYSLSLDIDILIKTLLLK